MFDKEAMELLARADAIYQANEAIGATEGQAAALPSDFKLHDLEQYAPNRRRARGTMTTHSFASFATYTEKHREPGAAVFVNAEEMMAVAVLNLGFAEVPGHADNLAVLKMRATAAYMGLRGATGAAMSQARAVEFLEDWGAEHLSCYAGLGADGTLGEAVPLGRAVAALRKITIEQARKVETEEQALSTSRSAFESTKASSATPLPQWMVFKCTPFDGLRERIFELRLSVLTTGDKPQISLRLVKLEQHQQEMAEEFAGLTREAVGLVAQADVPVLVGSYDAKR